MISLLINTLACWMAGEFENRTQAIADPAWFVHLHWWHRPLPQRLAGKLALFAEQSTVLKLNQPYRQRVMILSQTDVDLQVQYLALKQPEQFRGGGANPSLIKDLTLADLELLPGCQLSVIQQEAIFSGQMTPGTQCCFEYQGQTLQVALGFAVSVDQFLSYDRGIDPHSGSSLWGALMGPYQFRKCQDFSQELPL